MYLSALHSTCWSLQTINASPLILKVLLQYQLNKLTNDAEKSTAAKYYIGY